MLESKSPILGKDLAKTYRSCVMRAAYLSQDRPDISHTVKDLARGMVNPTEAKWSDLKRLGRFLKKYPGFTQIFAEQRMPNSIRVQVDSGHAGCAVTRRSTTGMMALFEHASNVQSTISLSTGESEYYALVKGGSIYGVGPSTIAAGSRNRFASSGRIRLQFGKRSREPDRIRKSEAHTNQIPMAARKSSHEPPEGVTCTRQKQSGRRTDQKRARGADA